MVNPSVSSASSRRERTSTARESHVRLAGMGKPSASKAKASGEWALVPGVLPDVEARFQVAEQRADNVPGYHVVDRAGTQALLLGFAERVAGKALGVEHCGAGERVLRRALGVEGDVAAFGVAGEQQGAVLIAIGEGGGGGVLHRAGERRAEVVAPIDVCGARTPPFVSEPRTATMVSPREANA